jgi:hypothetical protein
MQSACTQGCNQHAIGGRQRRAPRAASPDEGCNQHALRDAISMQSEAGSGELLEQPHLSLNVRRGEAARERGDPCVDLGQAPVALELPGDLGRGRLASLTPARLFEHGGGTGGLRRTCELERVLLRLGSRSLKPRARQIGDRVGLVPDEGCNQRLSEAIRDHRPAISIQIGSRTSGRTRHACCCCCCCRRRPRPHE